MPDRRVPFPYVPSILLVDDDPQVRTLFRRILMDAGYLVYEAGSVRKALRKIGERFCDVIVLDLSLPVHDGFEVLRMARIELPRIKVILVSGVMSGPMVGIAKSVGASA